MDVIDVIDVTDVTSEMTEASEMAEASEKYDISEKYDMSKKFETSEKDHLYARTYFLILALTLVSIIYNLFYNWPLVFHAPFLIGGGGSLIYYLSRIYTGPGTEEFKIKTKVICHAYCSAVYIAGAFILLVFYESHWLLHIWIVPVVVSARRTREIVPILSLLFFIFMLMTVIEIEGLLGNVLKAVGFGTFWGFSFYFLLKSLNEMIGRHIHDVT